MPNYTWFNSLVLVLAFLLLIIALPKHRRPVWVSAALLVVSAVALSSVTTLVGLSLSRGFSLPSVGLFDWELFVVVVLFILCSLGVPRALVKQPETKPRAKLGLRVAGAHLMPSLVFCMVYAWNYVQFTSWVRPNVWLTILASSLVGLIGTSLSIAFLSSKDQTPAALPQYRFALRFALSCFLFAYAVAFPLFNDPQGTMAYGVSYETAEGMVLKEHMKVDNYYNLASYYESRGEIDRAIALYSEAIGRQPDFSDAYLRRADLLMQNEQYAAAIADLDIAVTLSPTNTQAYYGRVIAYEALGDYRTAIQNLDQIVATNPADALAYLVRASLSLYEQDYSQVLADATKVNELSASPASPNSALLRGIAYLGQRNADEAWKALASLLPSEPLHVPGYYDEAPRTLAVLLPTPSPALHFTANVVAFYRGIDFTQIYASADVQSRILNNLAFTSIYYYPVRFAYRLSERFASTTDLLTYVTPAVEKLTKTASPREASAIYMTLGSLYVSQQQYETAQRYYERALDLSHVQTSYNDDLAELYYNLGLLNFREGDMEDALDYFSKALELNPSHKDALFSRAQVQSSMKHLDEAVGDMRRAVQLDRDWTEAQLYLGYYLSLNGQYEEGLRSLLAIEPETQSRPFYYHCLGYAYVAMGNRPEAISAYEKALSLINSTPSSSARTELYERIVDDLQELEEHVPDANGVIEDLWLMIRGAMAVAPNNAPSLWTQVPSSRLAMESSLSTYTAPVTQMIQSASSGITLTRPMTGILWVQLALIGPERIRPGSSDILEVVAELRQYPDSGGVAFPVELYVGHTYAIEVRPHTANFDISGETISETITYPLEVGKPVHWRWVLSPKPGYEGNQSVVYTVVVHDEGDNWSQEITTGSIRITVPTRYGIPAPILYPISGIGAAVGTFLALPVLNTLLAGWLKRRGKENAEGRKGTGQGGDGEDTDGERPRTIVARRD